MLSIFPELFNYSHFAPLILRVSLAVILLPMAYSSLKETLMRRKITGAIIGLSAIFILIGMFTQIASLLVVIAALAEIILSKAGKAAAGEKYLNLLIFSIAVSLMLLGPGFFAIDLPL